MLLLGAFLGVFQSTFRQPLFHCLYYNHSNTQFVTPCDNFCTNISYYWVFFILFRQLCPFYLKYYISVPLTYIQFFQYLRWKQSPFYHDAAFWCNTSLCWGIKFCLARPFTWNSLIHNYCNAAFITKILFV